MRSGRREQSEERGLPSSGSRRCCAGKVSAGAGASCCYCHGRFCTGVEGELDEAARRAAYQRAACRAPAREDSEVSEGNLGDGGTAVSKDG